MTYSAEAHAEIVKARALNDARGASLGGDPASETARREVREERWRITDRLIALAAIDANAGVLDLPYPPETS